MSSLLRVQDRSTRGVLLILAFELGLLLSLRATFLLIYVMVYIYFLLPSLRTCLCSAHVCALVSRERFLKSPLLSGRYLTYFAKFMNAMEIWKTLTHYDIAQENQILLNILLFRGLCLMKLSFKCFKNSNWPRLFGVFSILRNFGSIIVNVLVYNK